MLLDGDNALEQGIGQILLGWQRCQIVERMKVRLKLSEALCVLVLKRFTDLFEHPAL